MPAPLPAVRPTAPAWAKKLTDRERVFCEQYLVDLNKTAAALRCGFGSDAHSAATIGYELFKRPQVIEALDKAFQAKSAGARMTIIDRLMAITEANIGDFFEWCDDVRGVVLKKGKDVPKELQSLIKAIEIGKDGRVKLTLHDPVRAAEILVKLKPLGLMDNSVSTGEGTLEAIIGASMKIGAKAAEEAYQKRLEQQSGPVIEGECREVEPTGS